MQYEPIPIRCVALHSGGDGDVGGHRVVLSEAVPGVIDEHFIQWGREPGKLDHVRVAKALRQHGWVRHLKKDKDASSYTCYLNEAGENPQGNSADVVLTASILLACIASRMQPALRPRDLLGAPATIDIADVPQTVVTGSAELLEEGGLSRFDSRNISGLGPKLQALRRICDRKVDGVPLVRRVIYFYGGADAPRGGLRRDFKSWVPDVQVDFVPVETVDDLLEYLKEEVWLNLAGPIARTDVWREEARQILAKPIQGLLQPTESRRRFDLIRTSVRLNYPPLLSIAALCLACTALVLVLRGVFPFWLFVPAMVGVIWALTGFIFDVLRTDEGREDQIRTFIRNLSSADSRDAQRLALGVHRFIYGAFRSNDGPWISGVALMCFRTIAVVGVLTLVFIISLLMEPQLDVWSEAIGNPATSVEQLEKELGAAAGQLSEEERQAIDTLSTYGAIVASFFYTVIFAMLFITIVETLHVFVTRALLILGVADPRRWVVMLPGYALLFLVAVFTPYFLFWSSTFLLDGLGLETMLKIILLPIVGVYDTVTGSSDAVFLLAIPVTGSVSALLVAVSALTAIAGLRDGWLNRKVANLLNVMYAHRGISLVCLLCLVLSVFMLGAIFTRPAPATPGIEHNQSSDLESDSDQVSFEYPRFDQVG